MTSYRQRRVADTIREELAELLQREAHDPRFSGVSITSVETSQDLRLARVYFSMIGGDAEVQQALRAFEKASGYLRRQLASRVQLRVMPELIFRFDDSLATGDRIETLLHEINEESRSPEDDEDDEEPADDDA
jgi:ribosome-binding factor A